MTGTVQEPRATRMRWLVATLRDPGGPGQGVFARAARFLLAGGSVTLVYLALTTILADVAGLPFEVALPIGYATAICLHFTLQRYYVWVDPGEYALPIRLQVGRYLALVGVLYGLTAASTAVLPHLLGLPVEVVYVVTVLVLAVGNFLLLGQRVFHPGGDAAAHSRPVTRGEVGA
jgi:putative flippase GtrA